MTEAQKQKHRQCARAWAKRNPERRREINVRYRQRNKDRLRERRRQKFASMSQEDRRAFYRRTNELLKKRIAADPEYAKRRREQQRAAARKYIASHKEQVAARHKAYVEKNRERCNEYVRNRRRKNPERQRQIRRNAYYKDHAATLRKRLEYRRTHAKQTKAIQRRAEAKRKERKSTDPAYYAKRRADVRMRRAKSRVICGKTYSPRFHLRIPDWATMGQQIIDTRSQWLDVNLTASQRAYAKELAIARKRTA